MYIDSHCHLFDLKKYSPNLEDDLKKINIIVITSSTDIDEFIYNEELAKNNNRILPCFAIHPQMGKGDVILLEKLASEKRLSAIGECGFDLYNDEYKATENWQDEIFADHLEIAIKYNLPLILHVRRAMHKIFTYSDKLKKCKSVIFHSWSGTLEEGNALLHRGVNAYFSFGNTILNGHKQQVRSCAGFPLDRLLTETDAPYQPPHGRDISSYKDLPIIIESIASLQNSSALEIESQIETNFTLCLRAFV